MHKTTQYTPKHYILRYRLFITATGVRRKEYQKLEESSLNNEAKMGIQKCIHTFWCF